MARKEELRPATTTDPSGASPVQSNPNNAGASNDNDGDGDTSMTSADDDDDAAPSSSSSSSSESDSDSDSDSATNNDASNDSIATLTTRSKPDFSARIASGAPSLEDRLKSFLPQLAEANGRLEQQGEREKLSMEDVGEGEPHIEMNLGLGVLKEVGGKEEESESGSESENEEEEEERETREKEKEKDVMGKLMGGRRKREDKGGIEEVG